MNREELKDSFRRIFREGEDSYMLEDENLPFSEEWDLFSESNFAFEMKHFLEKDRSSYGNVQRRNALSMPKDRSRKRQ